MVCHCLRIIAQQRQHWRSVVMRGVSTSSYGERPVVTVDTAIIALRAIITDIEIVDKN